MCQYYECCESTIKHALKKELLPAGFRVGRKRLWRRDELEAWEKAGGPSREAWEAMKRDAPSASDQSTPA